jgi:hypothetical protein
MESKKPSKISHAPSVILAKLLDGCLFLSLVAAVFPANKLSLRNPNMSLPVLSKALGFVDFQVFLHEFRREFSLFGLFGVPAVR